MNDQLQAKFFSELLTYETFQAQIKLENDTYNSLLNKLACLDLKAPNLELEYANLRGSIEVIKQLRAVRERLATEARSRS